MKHSLLLVCLLSIFLFSPASGRVVKGAKVHASGAKITAVSANSISVLTGKSTHTYKISGQTLIEVDGRKAGANALHKGMLAEVTPSSLDPGTAMSVEASSGIVK
jgi:hypothetical protein